MDNKRIHFLFTFAILLQVFFSEIYTDSNSESVETEGSGSESGDDGLKLKAVKRSIRSSPSNKEITYAEILNKSTKAILGLDFNINQMKQTLEDHYFTSEESQSIWPKAIKETEGTLNLFFNERELLDMQSDIKLIYRRMLECDLLPKVSQKKKKHSKVKKRKEQVKCYLTINDFIDKGFPDFGFPRGSVEAQAKMLQIGLAYNVMSVLILQITRQLSIKANVSPNITLIADRAIIDIAENIFNFKTVMQNTVDAREQAVSQTEICQIRQVLWIEFEETCETRIKRDITTGAGIGGIKEKFVQKYRVKVVDNVTGKEVCSRIMSTSDKTNKEQVKSLLAKTCQKVRQKYVARIRKEIEKFYNERILVIVEDIRKMWETNKKKAAKFLQQSAKSKGSHV